MTCIVAVRGGERQPVLMGSDSCGSSIEFAETYDETKMFSLGLYLLGFSTSYRWGQILETNKEMRQFLTSSSPPEGDFYLYLASNLVPIMIKALEDSTHLKKKDGVASGGYYLIAYLDQLAMMQPNFSVLPLSDYGAVGSGQLVASGSLYSTKGQKPEYRVRMALAAAEHHNSFVKGPMSLLSTGVLIEGNKKGNKKRLV